MQKIEEDVEDANHVSLETQRSGKWFLLTIAIMGCAVFAAVGFVFGHVIGGTCNG